MSDPTIIYKTEEEVGKNKDLMDSDEKDIRYYVITTLAFVIPLIFSFYFIRFIYLRLRKKFDIEKHFAIALAIVHNEEERKVYRERVYIGVGSHPDNLREWVQDIW